MKYLDRDYRRRFLRYADVSDLNRLRAALTSAEIRRAESSVAKISRPWNFNISNGVGAHAQFANEICRNTVMVCIPVGFILIYFGLRVPNDTLERYTCPRTIYRGCRWTPPKIPPPSTRDPATSDRRPYGFCFVCFFCFVRLRTRARAKSFCPSL